MSVDGQQGDELDSGYRPHLSVLVDIQDIAVLANNVLCQALDGALQELVVVRPAASCAATPSSAKSTASVRCTRC